MFKMIFIPWHWWLEFSEDSNSDSSERKSFLMDFKWDALSDSRRHRDRYRKVPSSMEKSTVWFDAIDRSVDWDKNFVCYFFIDADFFSDFVLFILQIFLLTCLFPFTTFFIDDYLFLSLSNEISSLIVIKLHLQANEKNRR